MTPKNSRYRLFSYVLGYLYGNYRTIEAAKMDAINFGSSVRIDYYNYEKQEASPFLSYSPVYGWIDLT